MSTRDSTPPRSSAIELPITDVILPARNEAPALPLVLRDLPRRLLRRVVVVDNGSTDGTGDIARALGCLVVCEPRPGYGRACLAGIEAVAREGSPAVLAFLDADHSDHADELPEILRPIVEGRADFVVGSRVLGRREHGALLPQARVGNLFAAALIRVLYGLRVTDLGPFRAIRWSTLVSLGMCDRDFGWTVEMQVKAARAGVRYCEVPVSYRRRVGKSKITGTVSGSVRAGAKILYTVLRHSRRRHANSGARRS